MRLRSNFLKLALLLFLGTHITNLQAFQYTSNADTLLLKTEKCKGWGLFGNFGWFHSLKDIDEVEGLADIIPSDLTQVRFAREIVDMNLIAYDNIRNKGMGDLDKFLATNYPIRIDTAQLPTAIENSIRMIIGKKGGDQVLIVDQNNNNDFRDDPVRTVVQDGQSLPAELIPVQFKIYNGKKLVKDSGWVAISLEEGRLVYGVAQYFKSKFTIDDQSFEIQTRSGLPDPRFTFDHPLLSITAQNGVQKDSLRLSEKIKKGEYIRLGQSYYQFIAVSNDGQFITLIKEKDVSDKVGTQVGFKAANFHGITTDGDSIAMTDYRNKYLLIVNITACWSAKMSYVYYKELLDHYYSKFEIVAIDETLGSLEANIKNLQIQGPFIISKNNRMLKRTYRKDFCSRTCFLVDPGGHIVDKFEISNWKEALARHFE